MIESVGWAREEIRENASRDDVSPEDVRRWAWSALLRSMEGYAGGSWSEMEEDARLCADLLQRAQQIEKERLT